MKVNNNLLKAIADNYNNQWPSISENIVVLDFDLQNVSVNRQDFYEFIKNYKGTSKMKNIINAIIEFNAVWPDNATHLCTTADDWSGLPIYAGTIQPVQHKHGGYYDGCHSLKIGAEWWQVLCSEAEFKASTNSYIAKYKKPDNIPFDVEGFKKWLTINYLGSYRELEPVTVTCGQGSGSGGGGFMPEPEAYKPQELPAIDSEVYVSTGKGQVKAHGIVNGKNCIFVQGFKNGKGWTETTNVWRIEETEEEKFIKTVLDIICDNKFLTRDGTEAKRIAENLYKCKLIEFKIVK